MQSNWRRIFSWRSLEEGLVGDTCVRFGVDSDSAQDYLNWVANAMPMERENAGQLCLGDLGIVREPQGKDEQDKNGAPIFWVEFYDIGSAWSPFPVQGWQKFLEKKDDFPI
jgi:hypothetical protein